MPRPPPPPPPAAAAAAPEHDDDASDHWECLLCSEPIVCFGVFQCGHFLCDACALRMRTFPGANANIHHSAANQQSQHGPTYRGASRHPVKTVCPVCRTDVKELVITSEVPPAEDAYEAYDPAVYKAISARAIPGGNCHARLDGEAAKSRVGLLHNFFCPLEQCWDKDPETGAVSQEAFVSFDALKEHLATDHKMKYCKQCLDNRPAFLSEQRVYTDNEMNQHHKGQCSKDPQSFVGHPPCLFCGQRFYEGDALLKHMQMKHYTCDICNAGEFIFVFYKDMHCLTRHFHKQHAVCKHRDCENVDVLLRVFRDELALQSHMSRTHGEKQTLSAASLGFNFSSAPNFSNTNSGTSSNPPRGSGSPAPAAGAAPANAANTHADRISFDYIDRIQDVFTSGNGGTHGGASNRRNRGRDGRESDAAGKNESANVAELQKRLSMMLATHLQPPQQAMMKEYSKDFIQNRSKAAEYFSKLQGLFPDPDVLNAVFAPLVATLPDATKRDALQAAKTMMTSAEAMRHKKNQDEENEKRALLQARVEGKQQRLMSSAAKGASKAGKPVAGPRGVWTKNFGGDSASVAAAPSLGGASARQPSTSWGSGGGGGSTSRPQQAASGGGIGSGIAGFGGSSNGGGGGGRAPAAPTGFAGLGTSSAAAAGGSSGGGATFLDPESFPTLGTTSPTTKNGSAMRGASKPLPKSVWGGRR